MLFFLLVTQICLYTVVKLLGCVVAHLLLTVIDRSGLNDDRQVSARTDRNIMAHYLVA